MAVPSLLDTLDRMATNSAARTLTSTLNLARSEAVKRGRNVSICPSTSGTDCTAASWAAGWIVFVDANGDADGAAGSIDSGDTIIRVFDPRTGLTLTNSPVTNLLTYDNKGYGRLAALVTFTICPPNADTANARRVEISVSGRGRIISTGATCS
jgi:type IV fimbrial biogenesis protein FimT